MKHCNFKTRKANDDDRSFLFSLVKEKLAKYKLHCRREPYSKGDPKKFVELSPHEFDIIGVYVVLLNEIKVGAYHFTHYPSEKSVRLFWLASTECVKGVGSHAINDVKKYAINKDAKQILLSVNKNNQKAMKCYKKNRFTFSYSEGDEIGMIFDITI